MSALTGRRALVGAAAALALLVVVAGLLMFVRTKDPMLLVFGILASTWLLLVAAVVHILLRDDLTGVQRLAWLAVVVFVTPGVAVGAIVYLALGRARTAALFRDLGRGS